ncbi:MAG: hypothetical protein HY739_12930 [Desulfobacterales bacterium]|nr:hypothetical protein [Desulfobacterales bacterium]
MEYDSRGDTLEHIHNVQRFIGHVIRELLERGDNHDRSKLNFPEKECFDRMTPLLSTVTYGSDEYRKMLDEMRPAIYHHNQCNTHHPEHYTNGIDDMSLIDIVEMLCDWKAATMRHNDGDIYRSLEICIKRFGINQQLTRILLNTIKVMDW